jgi:phospholipid/cholesterol/gamma-HCH transport system substrate-binding protein
VGLFVICALAITGTMAFQFSSLSMFWETTYSLSFEFENADGIHPASPVRKNGIQIGDVDAIRFADGGGVLVDVSLDQRYRLRSDARPRLARTILGDASIEIVPGRSPGFLQSGTRVKAVRVNSPLEVVQRMESRFGDAIVALQSTSREWQLVGRNLNSLLETNRGDLGAVIDKAAGSLDDFSNTMRTANSALTNANRILANPAYHRNLERAISALPGLVDETRQTIVTVRTAVSKVDKNLDSIHMATQPLAKNSQSIVARLDATLANLQVVSEEFKQFSGLMKNPDGSLQKLVSDPQLYRNLNNSAVNLSVILQSTVAVMRDLRVFSDKVARHPELMGVSGALNGSSGLKNPEETPRKAVRQTSGIRRLLERK